MQQAILESPTMQARALEGRGGQLVGACMLHILTLQSSVMRNKVMEATSSTWKNRIEYQRSSLMGLREGGGVRERCEGGGGKGERREGGAVTRMQA